MTTTDEPNPYLCGSCDAGLPMPCSCPEPDEVPEEPEEPRGHDCDDPWSWNPVGEMCPRCGR